MQYSYRTSGTCSTRIDFSLEDGKLKNVSFTNGCNGNLKGLSALVAGMDGAEVIERLSGITCGHKSTSCPDQLARAVREALEAEKAAGAESAGEKAAGAEEGGAEKGGAEE